ncbi:MAG: type II toxin-antitoxin system RelE/ParE family toxin [Helicobacteraceae bacterium]|nr:type II toxin-antitoxin system RelE/ParE family toxin [Helicobacteraceae bacterium]
MLKTIQRSEPFKKSLLGILTFIAKDSKNKANIFKKALQEKINQLTFMPFKYRKSIYFEDENIRDFIFKGYCIPYVIDEENEKIILLDIIKYEKR